MLLDKLTSIAHLTDALGRAKSAEEVYTASLECLQQSLGVDRASILLFDENDVMSFVAWRGISDDYRRAVNGHTPWRPDSVNTVPVLVPDAESDPALCDYAHVFRREGIRALGFFALTHRDRVIGKFMLYYAAPHEFTDEEIALAETIAGQIAFGVVRIRVEQALEAERERLRAIVANVPGMVWETAGNFNADQKLTFVSDGIRELIGYTPEESMNDPEFWRRIIVSRTQGDMKSVVDEAIRDSRPAVHRYKLRRRDGRVIWAEVRSAHKVVNGTLMSRGVTMDITARKEAEQRSAFLAEASGVLSASMDYERSLTRIADLVVSAFGDWCVIDVIEDGDVVRIAAAHSDPAKAELMRRLKTDFAPSKHETGLGRRVIETNAPLLIATRDDEHSALLRSSAAAAVFEELGCESLMVVPISAAGHSFGAISIVSATSRHFGDDDLTVAVELGRRAGYAIDHARLYREATAANRAKDEFLATLSHELRTPMTAALGWASMLRLHDTPQETFKLAVETIERSIRAQAKLIDDIFDVSRIVTGKLQLQVAPVDLRRVIDGAIETIRPSISAKSLRLDVVFSDSDAVLVGDAARLQQVIWNLLSNAVKFTPAGGTVRIEVKRGPNDEMQIAVSDTGQGIPKRLLPVIFERFRQGDSSATRAHGGLGLGLAIVKNLVELHGGSVTVESGGEGRGAMFRVQLPLARPQTNRGETTPPRDEKVVSLAGVTVLVVEDDADTRLMLSTAFEQHGATVVAVDSATAALDALREKTPNVVVSDIAMPGEDGYSLMTKIRSGAVESCRNVPAIAISAFVRPEDRERIRAAGFDAQFPKPVDALVMLQAVRDVVAN